MSADGHGIRQGKAALSDHLFRLASAIRRGQRGGYTPTVDFKRKGATKVYGSYAGDDWFLPAETVWAYPF